MYGGCYVQMTGIIHHNLNLTTIHLGRVTTRGGQEFMLTDVCRASGVSLAENRVGVTKQYGGLRRETLREELADDSGTDLTAYDLLLLDHVYGNIMTTLQKVVVALLLMAKVVVIPHHQRTQTEA